MMLLSCCYGAVSDVRCCYPLGFPNRLTALALTSDKMPADGKQRVVAAARAVQGRAPGVWTPDIAVRFGILLQKL